MATRNTTKLTVSPGAAASTTVIGSNGAGARGSRIKLICSVVGATGGTIDLYVQHSFDGGATFYDCAHLAQLAGGAAASVYDINVPANDGTARPVAVSTASASTPVLGAGTLVPGPWGDVLRLVSVTGTGVSASSAITVTVLTSDS